MKRSIALLAALALVAGVDAALAWGGHGGRGGFHGSGGFHGVAAGHGGFHGGGGPHPMPPIHGGVPGHPPGGHVHFVHGRPVFVSGGFYYYYPYPYYPYYPYYPPAYYDGSAYSEPPTYVEQGDQIRYYCPDYRDYYPNVPDCPSQWLQVVPGPSGYSK